MIKKSWLVSLGGVILVAGFMYFYNSQNMPADAASIKFVPPVENNEPTCPLSTRQILNAWEIMHPESKYERVVMGNEAIKALKLYNDYPPRTTLKADRIYVYTHPKIKVMHVFFDNQGCVSSMILLPLNIYEALIGKAVR